MLDFIRLWYSWILNACGNKILHSEIRCDAHLCNLLQQQWPPLHPPLHFFNLLLVLPPALDLLFPAENTELWVILLHLTAHAAVMLLSGYLNSLSLVCCICERARWGSLAWARFDTTFCSFFSLCFCLSFHRSSSSSAFFLCSSAFLLRETIWSQMQGGLDGMGTSGEPGQEIEDRSNNQLWGVETD